MTNYVYVSLNIFKYVSAIYRRFVQAMKIMSKLNALEINKLLWYLWRTQQIFLINTFRKTVGWIVKIDDDIIDTLTSHTSAKRLETDC